MKKNQILKIVTSAFLLGLLASCNNNPKPSDVTDTSTGGSETVDLTEGVYNNLLGSKYDLLIKFYDEETFYFQNETTGFRGKYEVVEEEVIYAFTQGDGSIADTAATDVAHWVKGNTTIHFYQEDGVTPIDYVMHTTEADAHDESVVLAGIGYAYGTPNNVLAYDSVNDEIISFKANNASRSLKHNLKSEFGISDEKDIIQCQYMVTSLPEGAEGSVESDYFLKLSQKGYETNIPALNDEGIEMGLFEKDGSNYLLKDTISSTTATLVTHEGGATVTVGEVSIELVDWAEVATYAARLSGSYGSLTLNEDGSFVLAGLGGISVTGEYFVNGENELEFTFAENDYSATLVSSEFGENDTLTVVINVQTGRGSMDLSFTGTVTGELKVKSASVLLEADATTPIQGEMYLHMAMLDDASIVLSAMGNTLVTGYYHLDTTTKQLSFRSVSNGSFAFALANPAVISWTGKLNSSQTEDSTYSFEFAPTELGKIAVTNPAVKTVLNFPEWNGRAVAMNFYVNGTVDLRVAGTVIATATWSIAKTTSGVSFTFANSTNGVFSAGFGPDSTFVFTWVGVVPGVGSESTFTTSISASDLVNFN